MRRRGKVSLSALMTPNVSGKQSRVIAPASLLPSERQLFAEIVEACDPSHFRNSDIPLLTSFVQATLMALGNANKPSKLSDWKEAVKIQAMLATRLRLAPQSRLDPKTVHRHDVMNDGTPKPWETAYRA